MATLVRVQGFLIGELEKADDDYRVLEKQLESLKKDYEIAVRQKDSYQKQLNKANLKLGHMMRERDGSVTDAAEEAAEREERIEAIETAYDTETLESSGIGDCEVLGR